MASEASNQQPEEEDQLDAIVRQIVKEAKLPSRPVINDGNLSSSMPPSTCLSAPLNKDEWQRNTQANLHRVDALTRNVFERINANSAAEQAAKTAVQEAAKKERQKQHKKVHTQVKIHQEYIRKSYKCMKEIEYGISQVTGAEEKLVAERYARFAEQKVCQLRLQLRSKRPGPELIKDDPQRNIEKQMSVLNSRREELLRNEEGTKRTVQELRDAYESLGKDIGNRRMAMRHDISTIAAGEGALYRSEEINNGRSDAICEKAYKVAEKGLTFSHGVDELVKSIKKEGAAIMKQVEIVLALHTKDLAKIKENLGKQIPIAEGAIEKAQTQLKHMEARLSSDPSMQEAVTGLRALVRELQANRTKAIEDLRCKTAALDIDNSVRKVTAQMACEEAPKKKMQASSSAPNLGASRQGQQQGMAQKPGGPGKWHGNPQQGDMDTPTGGMSRNTPGGSSSLKAAAASNLVQRSKGY